MVRSSACVDDGGQVGLDLRLLAIADGLDEQIAQGLPSNWQLAQHIEDLPAQRLTRLFQLIQQLAINIAFTGFFSDQVPEMTDFRLADAVDATKTLLNAIGIPRQVIIDHQVGPLQIDAFAGGIGGQQNLHFGIVLEGLLRLRALLAADAAMDDDNRVLPAQQRGDAVFQIIQGVAMLGEDNELLVRGGRGSAGLHRPVGAIDSATRLERRQW